MNSWLRGLLFLAVLVAALQEASFATHAQSAPEEEKLYLSQALPVLSDAQSNFDMLGFYLPLGSVRDADDPTWTLAGQAAEALAEDADLLQTLSPPPSLVMANSQLSDALQRAADSASRAIEDLGAGKQDAGAGELVNLSAARGDFDRARIILPPGA